MPEHTYGWRRELPDQRDWPYRAPTALVQNLPPAVDLRPGMPAIWDQGRLGSCTAHASGAAYVFTARKQGQEAYVPSRLAIYYDARALEGSTAYDAGAYIRDAVKVLATTGAGHEALWAYDVGRFAERPPEAYYADATLHQSLTYWKVRQVAAQVKGCLAEGFPIVIGVSIYASFESDEASRTGVIPMPGRKEQLLGGHAILLCGYSDGNQRFTFRNSWGTGWGDAGYGYLPYPYVLGKLAADAWTVRRTE